MGRLALAAAFEDHLAQILTTDRLNPLELPRRKIVRRQRAQPITHPRHRRRAIIAVDCSLGVLHQSLGEFLLRLAKRIRVHNGRFLPIFGIKDDRFQPLRAHDRPQAAPGGNARGQLFLVQILDPGRSQSHFAARPDQGNGYFIPITLQKTRRSLEHAQANQVIGAFETRSLLAQVQQPPAGLGQILNDQGLDPQKRHLQAGRSTGVGFLYTASQRAFPSDRNAVAAAKHVPHQKPRRKDQLIRPAQRLTGPWHLIHQNTRHQAAPAQALPTLGNRFQGQSLGTNIDTPDI